MIYIITGDINSGKSSYLLSLFQKHQVGDGFYNRKLFVGTTYVGQEIIHLTTGKACPFSYRLGWLPDDWDELYTYQDYSFSRTGLRFCQSIIQNLQDASQPCYIDEIGPLELSENGLFEDFRRLLQTKKDIYVVIRNRCITDVLSKFSITDYELCRCSFD